MGDKIVAESKRDSIIRSSHRLTSSSFHLALFSVIRTINQIRLSLISHRQHYIAETETSLPSILLLILLFSMIHLG